MDGSAGSVLPNSTYFALLKYIACPPRFAASLFAEVMSEAAYIARRFKPVMRLEPRHLGNNALYLHLVESTVVGFPYPREKHDCLGVKALYHAVLPCSFALLAF